MFTNKVRLKEFYPFLENGLADPILEIAIQPQHKRFPDAKRPAFLTLPGGGYANLAPHEGWPVAFDFMALGCNGFILHYSTNIEDKQNTYPQQILEVACALDYICKNAEAFAIDTEKIAIAGFSAGGHLAASYCTMRNRPEVTKHITPTPVTAAVLCYPVITAGYQCHEGSVQHLLGKKDANTEERAYISCELHVQPEITPPTFIWAAANDPAVPVSNSLRYAQALADAKIPFELHIYPQGSHGQSTGTAYTSVLADRAEVAYLAQWVPAAKNWLKQTFELN